jgi:hypothetical protein
VNNEWERIWKREVVASLKYHPDMFLEGLRNTTKHLMIVGVKGKIRT